jgi:hypothetical protein
MLAYQQTVHEFTSLMAAVKSRTRAKTTHAPVRRAPLEAGQYEDDFFRGIRASK